MATIGRDIVRFWLVLSILAVSCLTEEPIRLDSNQPDLNGTKISGKAVNPFTSQNMRAALDNLIRRTGKNGRSMADIPSTTHNYVRFAPQNEYHLLELHNRGYDLFDTPLDQEITYQGEYYEDPSLPPGCQLDSSGYRGSVFYDEHNRIIR
jgi:hypothetical protein